MYYNQLSEYYKKKFGCKVVKLSFNGGFSCPNRINGKGGCIFCTGSSEFAGCANDTLEKQYAQQVKMIDNKWKNAKYIAYFGSFTNTFDTVDNLKKRFEKVLAFKDVVGLSIGTRPDSISDECLEYLIDLDKRTYLTIELGLQSMHDDTLNFINRGHDLDTFIRCIKKLKENNINVVVHIIDGLPFEDEEMMLDNIKLLNDLKIDGIKIHNLYIVKNTPIANMYNDGQIKLMSKDEYLNILYKQLLFLDPNIVVHRLTGDPKAVDLIAPSWAIKKIDILNGIVKMFKKNNTYQGYYYK